MHLTEDAIRSFLDLVPPNRKAAVEGHLHVLADGEATGSIFNVDLKDAKDTLNRRAEEVYKAATEHFWVGKGMNIDPDPRVNEILTTMDVRVYSVHDAISATKKLAKIRLDHPYVNAAKKAVAAILPIALALADLKTKVVSGRKPPSPEVLAERARRAAGVNSMERATCGCCGNDQAVLPGGAIHDHGYSLPREWMKTASCPGRGFPPLEKSDAGPKHMVKLISNALDEMRSNLAALRRATTMLVRGGYDSKTHAPTMKEIAPGHPDWKYQHDAAVYRAEREIEHAEKTRASFERTVAAWHSGMNALID